MSDPHAQPPRPADEPPSQAFQPMSYDLAPEYSTGPNEPANPTSATPAYPTSGSPAFPPGGAQLPPQSYPAYPPAPAVSGPPVGFPPPAYPPPPGLPVQQPRKRSPVGIVLGVIIGVLALCGVLSCVFAFPVISEAGATVSAPDTLPGGLTKDDSDSMRQLLTGVERQLKANVGGDEAVAGFYNDSEGHQVILVAASTLVLFPDTEVDEAFEGLRAEAQIDDVGEYDAGKLGGTVKCGTGKLEDLDMTVCIWADHGSAGMAMFLAREMSESAALFLQIREVVEQR